jgi:tripartite-type tricarboxylate transporter receptor subunit TctC
MNFMKFIHTLVVAIGLALTPLSHAADFPNGPVRIITSLPAGSGPDVAARKIADQLSNKWKVPVLVENKPGGGGLVGLEYYQSLPANGLNIFYGDLGTMVSTPILWKKTNMVENLRPVAPIFYSPMALMTSSTTKDYKDMLTKLREKPQYGSWGVGSTGHIAGAEFTDFLGIKAEHVPYKEYGQWYAGISNGDLPISVGSIGSSQAMEKAGKIKYIAMVGDQRDPSFPNVPTVHELFGDKVKANKSWLVFFINDKVPADVQKKLTKDIREVASTDPIQEQIAKLYSVPMTKMTDAEFEKMYANDRKDYEKLIKKFKISIN